MPRVSPTCLLASAAGVLLVGCVHNVDPKVTPAKVATVQPPIRSRATLVIAPAFETYTTQSSEGIHKYNYRLGESAARALTDLVTGSFEHAAVQRVGDAEVIKWLAAPGDTSADVLLVPSFSGGGTSQGLFRISADVQLRLDVRVYRTGDTFSWITIGHTARAISSRGGLTGSALEQALSALTDTLTANRARLEPASGP